jgi:hypothetical protein
MAAKKVLRAFTLSGSHFFTTLAKITVEIAQIRAVKIDNDSPIIIIAYISCLYNVESVLNSIA